MRTDRKGVMAPPDVLRPWRLFDRFPMETLTKAWVREYLGPRQRKVDEMERHRARFGASGNCFDLALWLRARFDEAGVRSWFVSDDIADADAHVAVIAEAGNGGRFLCDLGDMWLQPVAVDENMATPVRGLFPGADITLEVERDRLRVRYHRHGGKSSEQIYRLTPIPEPDFLDAAEANQRRLRSQLVEMRDFKSLSHWEYDDGVFRTSTHEGLQEDRTPRCWRSTAAEIAKRTGMHPTYVEACLEAFPAASPARVGREGPSRG